MMNVYMGTDVEDFIFSESTTYEDNSVTDAELNVFGVIECVDEPDAACYRIALENEQNYNAIMNAMMVKEIQVLEAGGTVVYEAGRVKNFLNRVKEQVQRFWAKVQGVFKKVMEKIGTIVLGNKAFIKKYRPIQGNFGKPEGKFEGYAFPNNFDIHYAAAATKVKSFKDNDVAKNEIKNAIATALLGETASFEDFDEKLRKKMFGADGNKHEFTNIMSLKDVLTELETGVGAKKAAKKSYEEAKKAVKEHLSSIKEAERELDKESATREADSKRLKNIADGINASLAIMSTALSVQSKAIVAKAQQDRKLANFIITHQPKGQKAATESFESADELDVVLI